jgi:hypothetical protein
MDIKGDREQLERKIARYKSLARTVPDYETMQRIKELVAVLEEELRKRFLASGHQAPFFTISKPLAANPKSMALATCELCSG